MKWLSVLTGLFALPYLLLAQAQDKPFLEIRPYQAPAYEQYAVHAQMDHYYPTQTSNHLYIRFDGDSSQSADPPAATCIDGQNCYDGHSGSDYWMPEGIPLLAAAPGKIVWAQFEAGLDSCPNGLPPNGDLGVVIIDHQNGYYSVYLHLQPPMVVAVGQSVQTGDTIGYNGKSGCAGVAHLHFEIRQGAYYFDQQNSWAIDPYGWWGKGHDPVKAMRGHSSVWLWKSSLLVDDGDNGFERFYGPQWNRLNYGYNGDAWEVPAVTSYADSRHYAVWVPEIPAKGTYDIQAFLPSTAQAVNKAVYEIYVKRPGDINEQNKVIVNQSAAADSFVTIARKELMAGANCAVILRDVVKPDASGSHVLFDAVRFVPVATGLQSPGRHEHLPQTIKIMAAYPNPFNTRQARAASILKFELRQTAQVRISVQNILGQTVDTILSRTFAQGLHRIHWDGRDSLNRRLPGGVYFYKIISGNTVKFRKIILIQ